MSGETRYMHVDINLPEGFNPQAPTREQLEGLRAALAKEIGNGITQKLFEFNKVEYDRGTNVASVEIGVVVPPTPETPIATRSYGLERLVNDSHYQSRPRSDELVMSTLHRSEEH